ncbi:ATP-dependent Clp protease proteolytic subunit [Vibrio fluvialis]|nr:ATP-dependent Clp protease proteolytic subunit [Vibrio fluvialis]
MANWSGMIPELSSMGSSFDILRRKYISELAALTGRNVICYYSGFLQKPEVGAGNAVNDNDKNGFMTAIHGLDTSKGLDLILHTPGGDTAATESLVDYLWTIFKGDIRCFVPQMAMSAGTMIACSCKEIWMGKQSSLGPVDPQFNGIPAHGVLEEFNRALDEIKNDPRTIPVWQPIVNKYPPAFLGECDKAIKWSTELVKSWLARNMFLDDVDKDSKIEKVINELVDHSVSYAHNRHLSLQKCKDIGLKVHELESDQDLQDKVLSVHHIYCHTLGSTAAFKIIENSESKAFIQQVNQLLIPPQPIKMAGAIPSQLLPEQLDVKDDIELAK